MYHSKFVFNMRKLRIRSWSTIYCFLLSSPVLKRQGLIILRTLFSCSRSTIAVFHPILKKQGHISHLLCLQPTQLSWESPLHHPLICYTLYYRNKVSSFIECIVFLFKADTTHSTATFLHKPFVLFVCGSPAAPTNPLWNDSGKLRLNTHCRLSGENK